MRGGYVGGGGKRLLEIARFHRRNVVAGRKEYAPAPTAGIVAIFHADYGRYDCR